MKTPSFSLLSAGLFCILLLNCVSPSDAWGYDGHRIVATIGQYFSTPTTQNFLKTQLGSLDLADISTIPDSYAHVSQGDWSAHLHYADCPVSASQFQMSYCTDSGGCVVSAISNYSFVRNACANNSTANNMTEPCPLSFLTHFTGDIHQPLHVGFDVDAGGNGFSITYFTTTTNLHSVWDSQIIYTFEDTEGDGSWEGFAQDLIYQLVSDPFLRASLSNVTDVKDWANESYQLARSNCYNMEPGTLYVENKQRSAQATCTCPTVGTAYYGRNIPVVKLRLMSAGIRLATLLNSIYDPSASSLSHRTIAEAKSVLSAISDVVPSRSFINRHVEDIRHDYSWLKATLNQ